MRRPCRARSQLSSKPSICTGGMAVDAAGISVKVGAHYPGRSVRLLCATGVMRRRDGRAEVSRGHSRSADRTEGLNMLNGMGARSFDGAVFAEAIPASC